MERRDNGGKIIAVVALVIAVIGLSVAYASYTSNLTIDGTAVVASNWDIEWSTPTGSSTGYADKGELTLGAGKQTINGTIGTLVAPGDSITWNWNVLNKGSINAILTGATIATLNCSPGTGSTALAGDATSFCSNDLEFEITYGGTKVTGSNLASLTSSLPKTTGSIPVTMKVTYKSSSTTQISGPIDVTLSGTPTFTYTQANA